MKRSSILIFLSLLLGLASGSCGRTDSDAARQPMPEYANDSTTPTNIAWQMHDRGAPLDSCIMVQQQAVEMVRGGASGEDPVAVLEQMGMFQMASGRLDEAMRYYSEARDSLMRHPSQARDFGAVKLYGDIALLWQRLGDPRAALAYNDSAMAASGRAGGRLMTDLLMFRADFFDDLGRPDSALNCYDRAMRSVDTRETNSDKSFLRAWVSAEKGYYMIHRFPESADTVRLAVALIESALDTIGDESGTALARFSLGFGHSLLGNHSRGLPMMEHAVGELREEGDPEYVRFALSCLMKTYGRLGMTQQFVGLLPELEAVYDSITAMAMRDNLAGAKAQYEIKAANLENELLRSKLEAAREHSLAVALMAVTAGLAVCVVIIVITRRNKQLTRRKRELDSDVESLTRKRDEIQGHNDILRDEIARRRTGGPDSLEAPELLTEDGVRRFKRAFDAHYPGFGKALRRSCGKITPHDELLCMLIYIGSTTEEIAQYLATSKSSVNTARYRLRQRLGLDKATDLNQHIKGILGE